MKHLEFENLLRATKLPDGQPFSAASIEKFSAYYQLVLKWNPRLHLTTITEPRPFMQLHLLESAWLIAEIAAEVEAVWDVGSGLGVPGVIIAILRPDVSVVLVEANFKKAVFLEEVGSSLLLTNVKVINARFQELPPLPANACLAARALEKMRDSLGDLLTLARLARQILLLGNEELNEQAVAQAGDDWKGQAQLLPSSGRRLLVSLTANR